MTLPLLPTLFVAYSLFWVTTQGDTTLPKPTTTKASLRATRLPASMRVASRRPTLPPQGPALQEVDLATIAQIREEGLTRSHIMTYAQALTDFVGPRLTGSPDFERGAQWCIHQLQDMGVQNARTESWGEFGMAWTQLGTSAFLVQPAPATFLAQATPWSPSTPGEVSGPVVLVPTLKTPADFLPWKGKLAGKLILYGLAPPPNPNSQPTMVIWDEAKLKSYAQYPLTPSGSLQDNLDYIRQENFNEQVAHFFAHEQALAVLRAGGEAGQLVDQIGLSMGWFVYRPEHKQPLPSAVIASEAYGRMARLLEQHIAVSLRLNIQTQFGPERVEGYNVLGDLVGLDPTLKEEVVLLGGHLDSWMSGTGATDNGAGVLIALEAMRILKALHLQPRRTIRIGLWGGEEQGELGSLGYVQTHLAGLTYAQSPAWQDIPLQYQSPQVITPKPEHAQFSIYFNADRGSGRFLGINTGGNLALADLFTQWIAPIQDLGFNTVTLRTTESTDSEPFEQVGLPAVDFIQSPRDDSRTHHSNLDTYERLSAPDLKQAATVMAIFVYNAAQRAERMPRKRTPGALKSAIQPGSK